MLLPRRPDPVLNQNHGTTKTNLDFVESRKTGGFKRCSDEVFVACGKQLRFKHIKDRISKIIYFFLSISRSLPLSRFLVNAEGEYTFSLHEIVELIIIAL